MSQENQPAGLGERPWRVLQVALWIASATMFWGPQYAMGELRLRIYMAVEAAGAICPAVIARMGRYME